MKNTKCYMMRIFTQACRLLCYEASIYFAHICVALNNKVPY